MSTNNQGNARNLNESKMQALQALVSSLSGEDKSQIAAEELSKRLGDVLGEKEGGNSAVNSAVEILNEEGLPIIDITEPAEHDTTNVRAIESYIATDDPAPLSMLSVEERLRRKAQQDRILAMLEEEEEREAAKQAEAEAREANDLAERARADARAETERKRAAREMQKKMGKALMASMSEESRKSEVASSSAETAQPTDPAASVNSSKEGSKPKKSVKFDVDVSPKAEGTGAKGAPGDVSFAPLRASASRIRPKATNVDGLTMKMNVVERTPQKKADLPERRSQVADSDDESEGDAPSASSMSVRSDDEEDAESVPLDVSEDDIDISQAQLQREAALEYFRLRESMGADFAQALSSSPQEGDANDPWNQPEVPLEATLSSDRQKPSVSRFKASRQARNDIRPEGVSIAGYAVSNAEAQAVRRVVRNGRLQDGKLVGGEEGESASEDDEDAKEATRKMVELLTRGDPAEIAAAMQRARITTADEPGDSNSASRTASPSAHTAPSKSQQPNDAIRTTPLADGDNTINDNQPSLSFRKPPTAIPVPQALPSAPTTNNNNNVASQPGRENSPIVASPSFPPGSGPGVPSFPPLVIESPSFPRRDVGQTKSRPNSVMSNVVERAKVPAASPQNDATPNSNSRPKVSRFKAERS